VRRIQTVFSPQVLSEGLRRTPAAPWNAIIPQLFARIGHPDDYVRAQVLSLSEGLSVLV
jgi:hypothetical protein